MNNEKNCSRITLIPFTNLNGVISISAAIILALNILVFSNPNYVQAQNTMYTCGPNTGVNISMVNCFTNDTADTYYHSFAAEKRQNETFEAFPTSPQITNDTMSINEIRNQTMSMDIIPGFDNDTAADLIIE
ncbi:MAG: hypothetical protein M3Y25_04375 [Thermoproteota archaeon]|nr:hypothetical protein [Thermoproteota archaeon]